MPQSMREQLEEAFDDDDTEDKEDGGTEETGGSSEDTKEPLGTTAKEPEGGEDTEEDGGDNSEGGDDAKGDKSDDAAPSDDKMGEVKEHDSSKHEAVKAPASWKPDAREHWDKIPEGAQKEIARREKHMDNMVRESADSRKFQVGFNEMMHPFGPLIAAQNSTPMESVKNLMTTAAGLTLGTPQQKAQIVSNIMSQYGIDVEVLDQILVGKPGQPQGDANLQNMLNQALAPINQFMGDMNTQRQNYETGQQQTVHDEIGAFAQDPKNEFFEDVRETMADLMDMSAKRNEAMSIPQAYEKACRMDDSINSIVNKRAAASTAAANKKDVEKKHHAASSITGGNAANAGEPQSSTIRGAIVDAWDDAS